jgi:hypothetical protein
MQKPFQITPEMEQEIDQDIATALKPGTVYHNTKSPEALTTTRNTTHGDFKTNARLSQHLKAVFRSYDGWDHLDDVEKESMDMIALKFSRILSGKSLEKQHWEDVEGYAHLVLKECK